MFLELVQIVIVRCAKNIDEFMVNHHWNQFHKEDISNVIVFVNLLTNHLVGLYIASEDGNYHTSYHLLVHKGCYRSMGHLGCWKAISNWCCNVVETILIMEKNENK